MSGEKDLVVVSMEGERTYTWSLLLALYSPTMATMMADQGSGLGITLDNVTSQDIQQVVEALQQGSRLDTPAAKALAIQQETGQPARSKILHVTPGLLKHLKGGHIDNEVKNEPTSEDVKESVENDMVESVFDRVSTRSTRSRGETAGNREALDTKLDDGSDDDDDCEDDTAQDEAPYMDNDSDSDFIMEEDDQNSIKPPTPKKAKTTALNQSERMGEPEIDPAKIKLHDFKFIEKIKPGEGRKKDKLTVTAYVDYKFQMHR